MRVSMSARLKRLEDAAVPKAGLAERLAQARQRALSGVKSEPEHTRAELESQANARGLLGRLARAHLRTGWFRGRLMEAEQFPTESDLCDSGP